MRRVFDARFHALTRAARGELRVHLAVALVYAAILGVNVGWKVAAAWLAGGCVTFAWMHIALRDPRSGRRNWASALNALAAMIGGSTVWTLAAIILWTTGDSGPRTIALVLLAGLLIAAHGTAAESRIGVVAFGATPTIAILVLPLALADFKPAVTLSLAVSLGLMLAYLVREAGQIAANVGKLKEAEQSAVRANQAKSSFLAMMSHELRTPMNGVLGMAHALKLTALNREQASHVDMIVRSGGGLMNILNDVLDLSKIEAGKMELELIAFDLYDLGQRVHDLWSEAASAKGLGLVFELKPGTPRWVAGDPTRLRQVMINLVSNALKFTREGQVRLTVGPSDAGPHAIELAVSDTGAGMNEAQKSRLFQRFSQAEVSTTREYGGTGLGLSICKQLIDLMGGEITVDSRPGEGSTFRVLLELPRAEPVEEPPAEVEAPSLEGLRVLVADDNAINQAVARAILEAVGAWVATASDGVEALARLAEQPFDLVLMDVHMPRMGGVAALSEIRAGAAGRADLPVIALTADAMAGFGAELTAHGFDAVAPKPINPGELVWAISALVRDRGRVSEPAGIAQSA